MRVVAIEEHHIIPEMSSYMDLSWLPPVVQGRLYATAGPGQAGQRLLPRAFLDHHQRLLL
jgi:hypothetical protein